MKSNDVEVPEEGFVIAVQYWEGDATRALRLARLLADIEAKPRTDVVLALCRRWDCPATDDMRATLARCQAKFPAFALSVDDPIAIPTPTPYGPSVPEYEPRTGHPDGANALWSGVVQEFAIRWTEGTGKPSIFTIEHDGIPLCRNWIDVLRSAHGETLRAGKRVTGCLSGVYTSETVPDIPHINGSLMIHASVWLDRPSMHVTPAGQAWDLFHAPAILAEARPTPLIKNLYGTRDWSPAALFALSKECAWLASVKDDSALEWAERTLIP